MPAPALLTAAIAALVLWAPAPAAAVEPWSKLWGVTGGIWKPAGRLPDFSFAGYKQGNEPLPSLTSTKSVLDFKAKGITDTQMLKAAVSWANARPASDGWVVLSIPAGEFKLDEMLVLTRSKLVLQGAGSGSRGTTLSIDKSLYDLYGPNPDRPDTGGYVGNGAFVTFQGLKFSKRVGQLLATVASDARKGSQTVTVDDASQLQVGQYYDMWWADVDGKFNNLMFDNKWVASSKYKNEADRVKQMVKIIGKSGRTVTLERHLPYDIKAGINVVRFNLPPPTATDVGVEGIGFKFKHELYRGHHYERGWSAVELAGVQDGWVRDVATVNADNAVLISNSQSVTVTGVDIRVSKPRSNSKYPKAEVDGHWGVHNGRSFDMLVSDVVTECSMQHDMGTDAGGKWSVFMNSKLTSDGGNLDLHRGLAGPSLYTNIDVGSSDQALSSGGPEESGPHALAGTTFWGIWSAVPVQLPHSANKVKDPTCAYGPVINLVAVNLDSKQVRDHWCPTWWYEPKIRGPRNLYKAQLKRRLGKERALAVMAAATKARLD